MPWTRCSMTSPWTKACLSTKSMILPEPLVTALHVIYNAACWPGPGLSGHRPAQFIVVSILSSAPCSVECSQWIKMYSGPASPVRSLHQHLGPTTLNPLGILRQSHPNLVQEGTNPLSLVSKSSLHLDVKTGLGMFRQLPRVLEGRCAVCGDQVKSYIAIEG